MRREAESGYALVAVLIAVTLLLTLAAISAAQFSTARQLVTADRSGVQAQMLAQSALNRALQVVHDRGVNSAWNGVAPCTPLLPPYLGPQYQYISHDSAAEPHREDKLNQNAWLYTGPICTPNQPPDVAVRDGITADPAMPTGWYHFVFVWLDEAWRPTGISPVRSVNYTDNGSTNLAYIPPRSDTRRLLPLEASPPYYRIYVAYTAETAMPPNATTELGAYHPITEDMETATCLSDSKRLCLLVMPAAPADPTLILTGGNQTKVLRFHVEGWSGQAKRTFSGIVTQSLAVKFYYAW